MTTDTEKNLNTALASAWADATKRGLVRTSDEMPIYTVNAPSKLDTYRVTRRGTR